MTCFDTESYPTISTHALLGSCLTCQERLQQLSSARPGRRVNAGLNFIALRFREAYMQNFQEEDRHCRNCMVMEGECNFTTCDIVYGSAPVLSDFCRPYANSNVMSQVHIRFRQRPI